jgi:hypothetical protein
LPIIWLAQAAIASPYLQKMGVQELQVPGLTSAAWLAHVNQPFRGALPGVLSELSLKDGG